MPEATDTPPSRLKRNLALFIVPAILSAAAILLLWQSHPNLNYWIGLLETGHAFLQANPWALVVLLATLPGIGFPTSPVLILFGVVIAPLYGMPAAVGLAIAAQSVCTIWTYLLAAGPLRDLLKRYVLKHRDLPAMSEANAVRLGLVLRLTPGIPYFIQNVVLGVLRMQFKHYLLVSIPTMALWTVGFVITGGALFEGSAGWAITGILLLIVLVIVTRMLTQRKADSVG